MQSVKVRLVICAWLVCAATVASSTVHQIGPELYAYISDNDSSANSTFLVTHEGILVVDTGLNESEGRKLLKEIRKISSTPVRYVVNTHYHPDHSGGNNFVGPEAVFFTTDFTRDHIHHHDANRENTAHSTAPNWITFPHAVTIHLGGHEIHIYHPGPAHTQGDVVVYFPDEHTVATGDLFLTNCSPAMDHGDMENWIVALDRILGLPVDHVVPGHFELSTKTELRRFRDYLAQVRDQVRTMYEKGYSVEAVKTNLRLEDFKDFRQYPQYEATFADNAAEYYLELARHRRPRKK